MWGNERRLTVSKSMEVNLKSLRKKGGIRMLPPLRCVDDILKMIYPKNVLCRDERRLELMMSRVTSAFPLRDSTSSGRRKKESRCARFSVSNKSVLVVARTWKVFGSSKK